MQAGNPYIAGSPLRDSEGFFGRRDILDWVLAEFLNEYTNALVLYGQRRVGKTTILLQLRHYLPSDKFFPIYFDLQDQAKMRLGEVLANLADVVGSNVNLSEHKAESFDNEGKYFRLAFLPDLYRALDKECRPVFLLDEFDVLDQGDEESLENSVASRALFPFLRQVMNDDIRPAFVFVVGRRTEDLRVDFNQMFKTALTKEVWVLDHPSAETLVRQAEINGTLKFTQRTVDRILQLTKNHAYLTQLICQRIWQRAYLNEPTSVPTISVDDVVSSISEALEVGDQALIWLWNGLGPAEKIYAAALAAISDEGKTISEDQVIKVLAEHAARLRRREVELAPQDLITRHVLELTKNREYFFAIELFRRWVKQKRSLKDVVDEIDKVDPLAQQLFQIGQDFYKKHEWSEAIRFFKDALRQNPSHFRANLLLGETLLAMGQVDKAVYQLETAYSLDNYESQYPLARALIALAKAKEKDGFDQDALVASERALEVSPNERLAQDIKNNIFERQGDNSFLQGDLVSALSAFEKAGNVEKILQVESERKRIGLKTLEQEAEAFVQKMEWKQAVSIYEKLVERAPDEKSKIIWQSGLAKCKEEEKLESLFTLGLGSLSRGDLDQAKKTLSEVVYIRPDYVKDNKTAAKLLEQAVAGRRPITLEIVFQSNLFRIFGSISLFFVIGYFIFSAIRGTTEVDTQNPSQVAETLTAVASEIFSTNTSQSTPTPTQTLVPVSFSLYDDFSSGSVNNKFKPTLWNSESINDGSVDWQDGYLVFSGSSGDHVLFANSPQYLAIGQIRGVQADLRIDKASGAGATTKIQIITNLPDGKGDWWAQCNVSSADGQTATINCDSYRHSDSFTLNYATASFPVELNKFYTVAIEIAPDASFVRYYLNGEEIGNFEPEEKDFLTNAIFRWHIGLWVENSSTGTGAADNIMIDSSLLPHLPTSTETKFPEVTSVPTSTPKADLTLYDDFKNTSFDGRYDTTLWTKAGDNTLNVFQENGALQLLTTDATQGGEYVLLMRQPSMRPIDRVQFLEAQLRVDEQQNGFSFVKIQIIAENINGYTWDTECGLGFSDGLGLICEVINFFPDGSANVEYRSNEVTTKLNKWYTVRIEIDSVTSAINYYLDGEQIGMFIPKDAGILLSAKNFIPRIGVWDGSAISSFKYQITEVHITP